jgi:hypothetical protein
MKKVKVTIEETISQEFEIEISDDQDIDAVVSAKYKNGELVLDNSTLTSVSYETNDNGEVSGWITL